MQTEKLSDTKKKILSILYEDGRKSLVELARELGITHVAVRKHLIQLEKQGLMRIQVGVNSVKMGLKLVLVFIEVDNEEHLADIVEKFKDCPRIVFLASMVGGYNLVALMVAEDDYVLKCISTVCAVRRMQGIRRSEVYLIADIVKPKYLPVKITYEKKIGKTPCRRDCSTCPRYISNMCLGCPATIHYRGTLL